MGDDKNGKVIKATQETHRGAFGEFGGEASGLIDRAFREQIVLVGVQFPGSSSEEVDQNLDELAQLVDTAGADPVLRVVQKRISPDPATFIGKGKAEEIHDHSVEHDVDTVVFDDELSPAQQFNLEKIFKRTALDRTAVILDIFAQNATTLEGKAQVELAQLRLRGRGDDMSQQAGGIGTRGPGETQLEVDRRRIQRRLTKLEKDLANLRQTRSNQRKSRRRSRFHTAAIVGYTNAGKSTLLNRLTGANVLVENRLFATLDATTRRLYLPGGETVLLSDTVGFIQKLPTGLVEAFKSTLEEVKEADLLVHVVDASSHDPEMHMSAVRSVLAEIGAGDVPELIVFNKIDQIDDGDLGPLLRRYENAVAASAHTGEGVNELLEVMAGRLRRLTKIVELNIPYSRGDILATVHREGEVLIEVHEDTGTKVRARLDEVATNLLKEFISLDTQV